MEKPVGHGFLFGLSPPGALALSAEVDEIAHAKLGGNQIGGLAILAGFWNKYADSLTRFTVTYSDGGHTLRATKCECGYTDCFGQDTVA